MWKIFRVYKVKYRRVAKYRFLNTITIMKENTKTKERGVADSSGKESFAIIETGGQQYRVASGDIIKIEKLPGELQIGDPVTFDKVLLTDDGENTKIGTPYLEGVKIKSVLVENGRSRKIVVIKYKAKSRYFKNRGHRQPYSKVRISSLS